MKEDNNCGIISKSSDPFHVDSCYAVVDFAVKKEKSNTTISGIAIWFQRTNSLEELLKDCCFFVYYQNELLAIKIVPTNIKVEKKQIGRWNFEVCITESDNISIWKRMPTEMIFNE